MMFGRRDRDVLLAVEHVGHRRRVPARVGLELPERRAARRVHGHEGAAVLAEEDEAARGGEDAAPGRAPGPICGSSHAIAPVRTSIARRTFWGASSPASRVVPRNTTCRPATPRPSACRACTSRASARSRGQWRDRTRSRTSWSRLPPRDRPCGLRGSAPGPGSSTGRPSRPISRAQVSFFTNGLARSSVAVRAVEHVEEPVAVRVQQERRGLPCQSTSTSTGGCCASQSQTSCGVYWKCHFSRPVFGSRARIESE